MTFQEFTGKNVEEAIRAAMREYGADLSDLDIEILSQGSRGSLGVGSDEARILAAPKSGPSAPKPTASAPPAKREARAEREAPAPAPMAPAEPAADEEAHEAIETVSAEAPRAERAPRERAGRGRSGERGERRERAPRAERPPRADRPDRPERGDRPERPDRAVREPAPFIPGKALEELTADERGALEEAKGILEELLRLMGIEASVEIAIGGETARLNVHGSELGVLIGRRGERLASLQHLVNLMVTRRESSVGRIAVDVENYRGRREEQLRDVAERAAKRVIQSGKIIQLEPMPAVERRIVHMALVENPRVRTQSVGVEPNRRIVILPASKVE
jgi:spoIIIJ-associated protein